MKKKQAMFLFAKERVDHQHDDGVVATKDNWHIERGVLVVVVVALAHVEIDED